MLQPLLSSPDVDRRKCELLGKTALIVQGLLGLFVLLSLVYKRYRETPHRPWRIWLFDVSKQVVGQMFIHGLNLLVSISGGRTSNGCIFYFLNILVDTTLGVAILYGFLHAATYVLSDVFHFEGFESGKYGTPPSISYWARQAAIYVLSLTVMKFLVLAMLVYIPGTTALGEWLLSWTYTDSGDGLQVIFVMGIFPIIMNIVQFWVIDSIVKASAAVSLDSTDDLVRSSQDREPLFSGHSDDEEEDETQRHVRIRRSCEDPESGLYRPSSLAQMSEDSRTLSVPSRDSKYSDLSNTDVHDYPPTLSSSAPSSSLPSSFTGTTRSTPSPALSRTHNSRSPPSLDEKAHAVPPQSSHNKLQMPQPQSNATPIAWDNSWDDGDDWTEHRNHD